MSFGSLQTTQQRRESLKEHQQCEQHILFLPPSTQQLLLLKRSKSINTFFIFFNIFDFLTLQIVRSDSAIAIYPHLSSIDSMSHIANTINLYLDSKIFPFRYFLMSSSVYEMYRAGYGIVSRQIATWSFKNGLEFEDIKGTKFPPFIWERRRNLTGTLIRGASVESPPHQIFKRRLPDGQIEVEGIMFELFQNLQRMLNFS